MMGRPVTRRRFVQASAAAAATATLEPSAFAQTARRAERAARDRGLAAGGRGLRQLGPHADDERARPPRAPVHAGLPGGHADGARPQLDPHRPPPVPLPGLVRPRRPAGRTRLGALRSRRPLAPCHPPPGGLLDRLCDRQPVSRLRAAIRTLPPQREPLRPHGRPDRRPQPGLERAGPHPPPLGPSLLRLSQGPREGRQVPRQQPPLEGPRLHVRRPRLPERDRGAEPRRRAPRPLRHGRGHLRAARALDAATALPQHVRPLARSRARPATLRPGRLLAAGPAPAAARDRPHPRPVRGRGNADRLVARPSHQPPPRPEPGARDRHRARRRSRHHPRRARLDGQDPDGAVPGAHARPTDRRPPRAPPRGARPATGSPRLTTWLRRSCRWPE